MTKLAEDIATLRDLANFGDVNDRVEAPVLRRLYEALSPLASLTPEQARYLSVQSRYGGHQQTMLARVMLSPLSEEHDAHADAWRIASTIFSRLGEP